MIGLEKSPVQAEFDAAITALFALEKALGPAGTPVRQRVYQLRFRLGDINASENRRVQEEAEAQRAEALK